MKKQSSDRTGIRKKRENKNKKDEKRKTETRNRNYGAPYSPERQVEREKTKRIEQRKGKITRKRDKSNQLSWQITEQEALRRKNAKRNEIR